MSTDGEGYPDRPVGFEILPEKAAQDKRLLARCGQDHRSQTTKIRIRYVAGALLAVSRLHSMGPSLTEVVYQHSVCHRRLPHRLVSASNQSI